MHNPLQANPCNEQETGADLLVQWNISANNKVKTHNCYLQFKIPYDNWGGYNKVMQASLKNKDEKARERWSKYVDDCNKQEWNKPGVFFNTWYKANWIQSNTRL
ncbi:hypothetical protein B0H14DRAFT_2576457 [Mycena olivaceomarginata]|nr:hypothetical protein B0H14DRAFT_2576457 [Mycena olivaceomarginata]